MYLWTIRAAELYVQNAKFCSLCEEKSGQKICILMSVKKSMFALYLFGFIYFSFLFFPVFFLIFASEYKWLAFEMVASGGVQLAVRLAFIYLAHRMTEKEIVCQIKFLNVG